jgi:hypothetical protein
LFGASGLRANPPLQMTKSMSPQIVKPGDTVSVCLGITPPSVQPEADIVWVLDITDSMADSIANIQANINAFTTQLDGEGINYQQGLYTFDDNAPLPDDNYGFASSDAQFQGFLNSAVAQVQGGGDLPENGLDALASAAAAMAWRPAASHTMILVTDAPVHAMGFDNLSPLTLTTEAAALNAAGFVVDVISSCYSCTNTTESLTWQYGGSQPPTLATMGDPELIPPLCNGQWLDIHSTGSNWNSFLSGLGSSVGAYTNVTFTDPLPPQLLPVGSSTDGATVTGNTLVWTLSSLGSGQGYTYCFLAVAGPGYYGAISNTASVAASNCSSTSSTCPPIFYVTYTDTPTITPSPTVTCTATVSRTITTTFTISPTFTVTPTMSPTAPPLLLTPHFPNPDPADANGVWLPYSVSTPAWIDVTVFDVAGEPVRLWNTDPEFQAIGSYERYWDLRNASGAQAASGIYLARIHARSPAGEKAEVWEKFAVLR